MDPVSDLKGKEIKRACLNELVDYIASGRGVLTEPVYPKIIEMVSESQKWRFVFVHFRSCMGVRVVQTHMQVKSICAYLCERVGPLNFHLSSSQQWIFHLFNLFNVPEFSMRVQKEKNRSTPWLKFTIRS